MNTSSGDYPAHIIGSLSSGMIALDKHDIVISTNSAAAIHLNLSEDTLHPGASFDTLPGIDILRKVVEELKGTRQPILRRELRLSGERDKILGLTASLLEGPDAYNGATMLFTDLTEVRRLERATQMNRQLAQIGELTAGVVHEIRNPLGVISGMAQLLQRSLKEDEKQLSRVDAILRETERINKLVTQFLLFARPFEVKRKPNSVQTILNRVQFVCKELAKQRQVVLDIQLPVGTFQLDADQDKLAQALENILRNALEIVPEGEGQVTLIATQERGQAIFRVEDNGPGLPEDENIDLFAPFVSKKKGGTGLGLSIVHRIIIAHDGRATYGNRPEGGAWFELRLPLTAPVKSMPH